MLDIKFIRENSDIIKEAVRKKHSSFNVDELVSNDQKRLDILYGARIAWILPLYKRAPQEFYTY